MRALAKSMFLLMTTGVLSGCAGEMQGVVRGKGTPVKFSYEQGMNSDTLTAVVDGEQFNGKAVMADSRSVFGTTLSGNSIFGTSTSGQFVATLLGSKGSTMRCNLNYADSSGFTGAGGVGVCEHNDGRIIDIVW